MLLLASFRAAKRLLKPCCVPALQAAPWSNTRVSPALPCAACLRCPAEALWEPVASAWRCCEACSLVAIRLVRRAT